MATENHIDFTVRVKNEGLGELAGDLSKVEEGAKGLGAAGSAGGAGVDKLGAAAGKAGNEMGAAANKAGELGGGVSAIGQAARSMAAQLAAAFTVKELVAAAAQMESMREGLRAVSGSAEQAGRDMDFVRTVANRVGADVVQVGQAYLGLAAATKGTAVEGEPTRAVFEAVATSMGKAGKSAAETQNALVALAQMASKGTVSMEELRGQLGEALPGALQAAANGLGITTQDLIKLVENGEIAASDLFPALTKGLNDLYGGAPAAQTLSQEIANIKNAFVEMAANLGDAGGLDALKVGAEVAQAAIVYLDDTLVTTGKTLGVLAAAVATLDFSGVSQAFADIEAESRDKLLKAAQHNGVLRASIEAGGTEAMKAALAQQELGNKTTKAGADAAAAGPTWVKLASDYGKVLEAVREQIAQSEKSAIARDAEGKAAVALAQAFGTEAEQRKAVASAAQASADAQAQLAQLKATEVEVMKAELAALQALAEENGKLDEQQKKKLQDLQKQIDLRQQDADKAAAQAGASRLVAEQAKAEAEAVKDNSARVAELRDAYEKARAKVEELRAAKQAGKATTEQVTQAEMDAGRAALLYRDALADQLKAIDARSRAQRADLDVQAAGVQLAIEQQRTILEVARARGDETGAMRAQEQIRRLEIQLLELSAQAKYAEADAAIAATQAKKAELIASGEYSGVKKLEIDAAIKAAEVKRLEGQIAQETANRLRQLGDAQGHLKNKTEDATDSLLKQAGALERLGEGVQRVGEGFRNKDGMTSDAQGNVQQQFAWNRSSIIDYLKQSGLDELLAERLAKQFSNPDGSVDYKASAAQLKWGGKYSTLAEALGKMADYYKHDSSGKHEAQQMLEYERTNAGLNKPADAPTRSAPAGGGRERSSQGSSGSGVSAGATYVSNITVDGRQRSVRYADRSSQLAGDALIRELAQAKGVSQ
jgi:tape measure domain-containing protein